MNIATSAAACDVSDAASVESAIAQVASECKGLHVLVNNAGIMTPQLALAPDMPTEDFDRMIAVHLRGTFLCSRAAIPYMRAAKFGRIVNLSSVLGILGLPYRIGYAAAKTGINGITRALAVETARHGITVNAVAPGYILTSTLRERLDQGKLNYALYAERAPAGRWGLPEEVGRLIAFLAQPGSGFITGTVIPIDGGYTMRGDPGEDIGAAVNALADVERLFGISK
jgi:NAD(P)-dependent dehydrogenase (short-subunit alcohol dehydrogenase family)